MSSWEGQLESPKPMVPWENVIFGILKYFLRPFFGGVHHLFCRASQQKKSTCSMGNSIQLIDIMLCFFLLVSIVSSWWYEKHIPQFFSSQQPGIPPWWESGRPWLPRTSTGRWDCDVFFCSENGWETEANLGHFKNRTRHFFIFFFVRRVN